MIVKSKINDFKTQNLFPKCTKNQNILGLCPEHRWGAYSAPQNPIAGFRGRFVAGREGRGGTGEGRERERGGKGKGGKGRGEEKREGRRRGIIPPPTIPGSAPGHLPFSESVHWWCQLSGSQLTCRGTTAATHVLRLRIEERPRSWTRG